MGVFPPNLLRAFVFVLVEREKREIDMNRSDSKNFILDESEVQSLCWSHGDGWSGQYIFLGSPIFSSYDVECLEGIQKSSRRCHDLHACTSIGSKDSKWHRLPRCWPRHPDLTRC